MKKKKINTKLKERKDFGIGPIHLAAFLLDPKMQGSTLDSVQLLDAMEFYLRVCPEYGERKCGRLQRQTRAFFKKVYLGRSW